MTATLPPNLRTLDEVRSGRVLLNSASPVWDRPLVAVLIAAGIDLAERCASCRRLLVDHGGPLAMGERVNGAPALMYGDQACADASAWLPGDVRDGGWVGHEAAA